MSLRIEEGPSTLFYHMKQSDLNQVGIYFSDYEVLRINYEVKSSSDISSFLLLSSVQHDKILLVGGWMENTI